MAFGKFLNLHHLPDKCTERLCEWDDQVLIIEKVSVRTRLESEI